MRNNRPLIWNVEKLEQMKQDLMNDKEARAITAVADRYCKKAPVVVVDKGKRTFEPNVHYYCSVGQYWWPDSLHADTYIRKDGIANPESKKYDRVRLTELAKRCEKLSQAFYLTKERKYYDALKTQLRAWFINEDTYMFPNFEYSQVIPGQDDNKWRGAGIVDAYDFNTVIESIRLVNRVKRINRRTMKGLQKWFLDFAVWTEEGPFGEYVRKKDNNIGLAADVTLVNMYLFAGDERRAKEIADSFAEQRIYKQITEVGLQPAELERTNAFSYSLANITHLIDFCFLVRYWDTTYYLSNHDRIDAAFNYLGQFIENERAFPYKQIGGWDADKDGYRKQAARLEMLKNQ